MADNTNVSGGTLTQRLAAEAGQHVVVLHARRHRGAQTSVSVRRGEARAIDWLFEEHDARSPGEHVLRALGGALIAIVCWRPTAVLLITDDPLVDRLLVGSNHPRGTRAAWDALQQRVGCLTALGARVFAASVQDKVLVALNAETLAAIKST
jgi:hypothetical protein